MTDDDEVLHEETKLIVSGHGKRAEIRIHQNDVITNVNVHENDNLYRLTQQVMRRFWSDNQAPVKPSMTIKAF
jgi:hypothetical protein